MMGKKWSCLEFLNFGIRVGIIGGCRQASKELKMSASLFVFAGNFNVQLRG